jgi:selenocysteine-specific elongation factor
MTTAFREGGLRPPDVATLGPVIGATAEIADRMLKLLLRQRVLVKVDTLYFHAEVLEKLKREVSGLKAAGKDARVDVATFKERFGVTRKFAIPLLEYLDRERVTRRAGEGRVVL